MQHLNNISRNPALRIPKEGGSGLTKFLVTLSTTASSTTPISYLTVTLHLLLDTISAQCQAPQGTSCFCNTSTLLPSGNFMFYKQVGQMEIFIISILEKDKKKKEKRSNFNLIKAGSEIYEKR